VHKKLIQCGETIEIFEYEKDLPSKRKTSIRERGIDVYYKAIERNSSSLSRPLQKRKLDTLKSRRLDNLRRSKKLFERIVKSNLNRESPPVFLSLTFIECGDLSVAFKQLKAFIRRLNKHFGINAKYIAVPEFQDRGTIHFHLLIFSIILIPYGDTMAKRGYLKDGKKRYRYSFKSKGLERDTRVIQNLWGFGYVDIIKTDGGTALAGYLSKYFTKSFTDTRIRGQKCYVTSRNIERPRTVSGEEAVNNVYSVLELNTCQVEFQDSFDTVWLGNCQYKKIIFV